MREPRVQRICRMYAWVGYFAPRFLCCKTISGAMAIPVVKLIGTYRIARLTQQIVTIGGQRDISEPLEALRFICLAIYNTAHGHPVHARMQIEKTATFRDRRQAIGCTNKTKTRRRTKRLRDRFFAKPANTPYSQDWLYIKAGLLTLALVACPTIRRSALPCDHSDWLSPTNNGYAPTVAVPCS